MKLPSSVLWSLTILATSCRLLAQPTANPGPQVGPWGDHSRLEFHGVKTFPTNDLVKALLQTPGYLVAAHPAAPGGELSPTLAKLLTEGYRNAGFRDAKVEVQLDEARRRVRVAVTEGPRWWAGKVRVERPGPIPVAELVRLLTERRPKAEPVAHDPNNPLAMPQNQELDPVWETGTPVGLDARAVRVREQGVKDALEQLGFYFARFQLRLEPEPGGNKLDLVVTIEHPGPTGTLGPVEVEGLTRHTPAELLQWLGIKSGQRITPGLIPQLEQRMAASARFLEHRVEPAKLDGDDRQVALRITAREYTNAPPLGAEFSPLQQRFLRVREWLVDAFARGQEFRFQMEAAEHRTETGDFLLTGEVEVILRRDALAILQRVGGKLQRGAVFSTNGATYVSLVSGRKLTGALLGNARMEGEVLIVPERNPHPTNAPFHISVVGGMRNLRHAGESLVAIKLQLAPGALIHEARHFRLAPSAADGVLRAESTNRVWQIRQDTGALVELSHREGSRPGKFLDASLRPSTGALAQAERELAAAGAALPNALRPAQPIASVVGAMTAELLEYPLTRQMFGSLPLREQLEPATRALQRLLLSGIVDPFEPNAADPYRQNQFFIPTNEEPSSMPEMLRMLWSTIGALVFRFTHEHVPPDSWPATLAREAVMLFAGQPKYTGPELERLHQSPATGPLGHFVAAQLLSFSGNRQATAMFAERGLQRLTLADFQRDAGLLLGIADSYLRQSGKATETLTSLTLEEITAVINLVPALMTSNTFVHARAATTIEAPTVNATATVSATATNEWSVATRALALRTLAAVKLQPERSVRAAVEPLLADWWRAGLATGLEQSLRTALTNATALSEAERLFQQGVARLEGRDGPANPAEAARLLRQAADRGSAPAAHALGVLHERGLGLERSFTEALLWYGRAASNGVVAAQMKLGETYSLGFDVPTDHVAATFWYRLAELSGDRVAGAMANATARRLTAEQQAELTRRLKGLRPVVAGGGK